VQPLLQRLVAVLDSPGVLTIAAAGADPVKAERRAAPPSLCSGGIISNPVSGRWVDGSPSERERAEGGGGRDGSGFRTPEQLASLTRCAASPRCGS